MHKIPWRFLCKSLWLGDYRGHISLAYPGTIPGAVNTLGGGSGLPGGRSADRRGRRSRRQIIHRRQAVGVGGSDGGGGRHGGRHGGQTVGRTADSSGSRQDGQPSASTASREGAGDTKRAGPRRNTMPRRRTGAAPARAIHRQRGQPSDSAASQQATGDTKRPRPRRYHDTQARAKF